MVGVVLTRGPLRLAGAVLVGAREEWQTGDRRCLAEGSMTLLAAPATDTGKMVANRELIPAWSEPQSLTRTRPGISGIFGLTDHSPRAA